MTDPLTLQQVADILGCSRQNVSRVETRIFLRIATHLLRLEGLDARDAPRLARNPSFRARIVDFLDESFAILDAQRMTGSAPVDPGCGVGPRDG